MKKSRILAAALLATGTTSSHAAIMWDFNYTDVGVGFNDPTEGANRQSALEMAAGYVGGFLNSYTATIEMDVDGSTSGGGTLAAAGSNFNSATFTPGFGIQGDIMIEILSGSDPVPGTTDGTVTWNFTDFVWELGNDFQAGEFDFFSTAVHELLHSLGFASEIAQNGNDGFGTTPGNPGAWAPFDQFLADASGTLIDPTTFVLDQTRWGATSLSSGTPGCGAGIQFTGTNAVTANGGQSVEIYSPSTWEPGSSGSHLDDNCYTAPGNTSTFMMEAQTIDGLGVRTISNLEVGIFRDIGYTNFGAAAVAVPEPSTISLLLGALGLMSLRLRGKAKAV